MKGFDNVVIRALLIDFFDFTDVNAVFHIIVVTFNTQGFSPVTSLNISPTDSSPFQLLPE